MFIDNFNTETSWDSQEQDNLISANDYERRNSKAKNMAYLIKKQRKYRGGKIIKQCDRSYLGRVTSEEDQESFEQINSEFSFLRTVWAQHRLKENSSTDEKLDHLSKVVAMIKGRLSSKIIDQKIHITKKTNKNSFIWESEYEKLKEKYERQMMKNAQLEAAIQRIIKQKEKEIQIYQNTKEQLKRSKDQQRALENKFFEVSKRQQELKQKVLRFEEQTKRIEKEADIKKDEKVDNYSIGQSRTLLKVKSEMINPSLENTKQESSNPRPYLILSTQQSPRQAKDQPSLLTELSYVHNTRPYLLSNQQKPLDQSKINSVRSEQKLNTGKFIRKNIHTGRFIGLKDKPSDCENILNERKFFSRQVINHLK